jgi:small-conductance mechanosensitive channel/CRP-like cAMP-binding protein
MNKLVARTWGRIAFLLFAMALAAAEPSIAIALRLAEGSYSESILNAALESLVLIAGALLIIRLLHVLVWHGLVTRQSGGPPPRLLTDLVDVAVLTITLTLVIAFVFDMPVNGLIATSGVAVAVIGFALKSMISDLFSGIAITIERPFRIGDWIEIQSGAVGQVRTMSWRATGLDLESGLHLVVPNSQLSEMVLKIYDRPEPHWRDELDIMFGYDVSAHQAERVLLSAAADVPEVAASGEPHVRIMSFDEKGVVWRLRFWVPDYPSCGPLRYAVQRNILRNLHFSGITLPLPRLYTQMPVPESPSSTRDTGAFIRRVPLFAMLRNEELADLVAASAHRLVSSGTAVVGLGDRGDSLFLVKDGLLEVLLAGADGEPLSIARLQSGHFFGEMSLLTGAPRAATVRAVVDSTVIEINKAAMEPILMRRVELMEAMSTVLADRQLMNARAGEVSRTPSEVREERRTLAHLLLGRMRAFFRIGAPAS